MLLALVRGIHRWPVNSPHKGPVTQNMFPFNDVIIVSTVLHHWSKDVHIQQDSTTVENEILVQMMMLCEIVMLSLVI